MLDKRQLVTAVVMAAIAIVCPSTFAQDIEDSVAAPFGIEIGRTTCSQAVATHKMHNHMLNMDSVPASAQVNPEGYPGDAILYIQCALGGESVVSYVSVTIFGGAGASAQVISDLSSKYARIGSRSLGGGAGLELRASNGNIMVYSKKINEGWPSEELVEVRYFSPAEFAKEKMLEERRVEDIRAEEERRRNIL